LEMISMLMGQHEFCHYCCGYHLRFEGGLLLCFINL
jgi:hypothetical protein